MNAVECWKCGRRKDVNDSAPGARHICTYCGVYMHPAQPDAYEREAQWEK